MRPKRSLYSDTGCGQACRAAAWLVYSFIGVQASAIKAAALHRLQIQTCSLRSRFLYAGFFMLKTPKGKTMSRYSRKWDEERLLAVLAYRPYITVSHFAAADAAKRRCIFAARKRGLVVLENRCGEIAVRLACPKGDSLEKRRYGRYGAAQD
jgi:hypothetical protein